MLCPALWRVLKRSEVPLATIAIFRSFHAGMSAKVMAGQEFTESIGMCNRMCLGYTMAPLLYSCFILVQ